MGLYLGIDCSMRWTNMGLSDESGVLVEMNVNAGKRQASLLPGMLSSLMSFGNVSISDITVLGVTVGPGFFTGIRIGMAFAVALAFASEKQIVAIDSLEVMVQSAGKTGEIVAPVLKASRGNLFGAAYRIECGGAMPLCDIRCCSPQEFCRGLEKMGAAYRILAQDKESYDGLFTGSSSDICYSFGRPGGGAVSELCRKKKNEAVCPSEIRAKYHRAPDVGKG